MPFEIQIQEDKTCRVMFEPGGEVQVSGLTAEQAVDVKKALVKHGHCVNTGAIYSCRREIDRMLDVATREGAEI